MKIIKLALAFVTVASFITLSGCATIAGCNTRVVHVDSYPAGASIYVDNQQYGITPGNITLPTYIYGGKVVVAKKRGYQDQAAVVNTQFQPISLLDIFLWPTFIVDAAAGNLVKIDPCSLNLHYRLQKA